MRELRVSAACLAAGWISFVLSAIGVFAAAASAQQTAPGLKVAFTGDQGLGSEPEEVLRLVRDEGAEVLFVQGDFDYADDPEAWVAMLDSALGESFPVIALAGNHDELRWYGAGGYQDLLAQRMERTGVSWVGELGVQSTVNYKGLFVVQTAPNVFDGGYDHAQFISDSLAADDSIWSISGWHKVMQNMNVGGKGDEVGWPVYEESRRGGAIIATAHEHSYSRTHLLSNVEQQTIASTAEPLALQADDPSTEEDEGRSFVFVSGLGGSSIRDQERGGDWWASTYTSTQGASNGALFAVFHVDGDPRLAHFYFKDVTGKVVDDFMVRSEVGVEGDPTPDPDPAPDPDPTPDPDPVPDPDPDPDPTPDPDPEPDPDPDPVPDPDPAPDPGPAPDPEPDPAPLAACADGIDNDDDHKIDYPSDKGCKSSSDPFEERGKKEKRLLRQLMRQLRERH